MRRKSRLSAKLSTSYSNILTKARFLGGEGHTYLSVLLAIFPSSSSLVKISPMYKAFLIDLDGTLIDSLPFYIKVYEKTLDAFGFSPTKEEIVRNCLGKKEMDVCNYLGISEKFEDYKKIYSENKRNLFHDISIFPGAEDFLKQASTNSVLLALNSIAHRWYVDMALTKTGLEHPFDTIISFEDAGNPKPSADPVFKVAEIFKIRPEECLVIGDGLGDIKMGKAAGAKTVLFFPKENQRIYGANWAKELKADFVVKSFEELSKLLFG